MLKMVKKVSLKYDFRGSGWLNVRKNASISANGTLCEDIECDSPSMAAALVAGGARNGLTSGRIIAELLKAKTESEVFEFKEAKFNYDTNKIKNILQAMKKDKIIQMNKSSISREWILV